MPIGFYRQGRARKAHHSHPPSPLCYATEFTHSIFYPTTHTHTHARTHTYLFTPSISVYREPFRVRYTSPQKIVDLQLSFLRMTFGHCCTYLLSSACKVNAHKELPESSKQRRRNNKNLVHSKAIISIKLFLLQISLQTIMQQ